MPNSNLNFELGTIWTEDNLKIMRGMNSNTVDLIYADPPFNSDKKWQRPLEGKLQETIERLIENDEELLQKWCDYVDDNKDSLNRVLIKFNDAWEYNAEKEEQHETIIRERFPALHQIIEGIGESHSLKMKAYMIFMAVRIIEMKRILRDTGVLCLHCDDSAGHYLKILLDAIFESSNFRCDIAWKRQPAKSQSTRMFGRVTDNLMVYSKGDQYTFNSVYTQLSEEYIKTKYRYDDHDGKGRYRLDNLVAFGGYHYDYEGYQCPAKGWGRTEESMRKLHKEGKIHFPVDKNGNPAYHRRLQKKLYLSETKGIDVGNMWFDPKPINSMAKEKTGYPTQKPLALLERVIQALSNKGDIVFDPFCGCATAIEAAYRLGRNWIGCDQSFMSVPLVRYRLQGNAKAICNYKVNRTSAPVRKDIQDEPVQPNFHSKLTSNEREEIRMYYFGQQKGVCLGCGNHYDYKIFHLDHRQAKSKGGKDAKENLQLLCGPCNSRKGAKDESECSWMWKHTEKYKIVFK